MEKDFTLRVYGHLLGEILNTGLPVFPLEEYFRQGHKASAFFILRHDVDIKPFHALRMARFEFDFGIRSTYYFRVTNRGLDEDVIRKISRLGHEIGYHYEVIDKARGDISRAKKIFSGELSRLRSLSDIHTAAMHGNPMTTWDNRVFWRYCLPSQFHLLGEAYISVQDREILYVTDTGRGWNRVQYNLQDYLRPRELQSLVSFTDTWDFIEAIRERRHHKLYIQVHPNRWSWRGAQWYIQWAEDAIRNRLKRLFVSYKKRPEEDEGFIN